MPGANCSVFGCGTCRNQKEFSIFKLPSAKDDYHTKWRNDILHVISRDRVIDSNFKRLISSNKVYVCEKHFSEGQIYTCKYIY